jgi:vacuolar-type H+-ATPase subunit D/Vma8
MEVIDNLLDFKEDLLINNIIKLKNEINKLKEERNKKGEELDNKLGENRAAF